MRARTSFRRLVAHDFAWGLFIFLVAAGLGVQSHWPLVHQGFQGELASELEKWRTAQRQNRYPELKTINLAQAYALHRQGQALFVDARPAPEYDELHVAGALNLPAERLRKQKAAPLPGVDRNRPIVVYCGQVHCDASLEVAEHLQAQGFDQVMVYLGGFRAWDRAGYPVDITP